MQSTRLTANDGRIWGNGKWKRGSPGDKSAWGFLDVDGRLCGCGPAHGYVMWNAGSRVIDCGAIGREGAFRCALIKALHLVSGNRE